MFEKNNNDSIKKVVTVFGNLLNEITIDRFKQDGTIDKSIDVPIVYASRANYFKDLQSDIDKKSNLVLPRMAFSMTNAAYDATRKLNTFNSDIQNHNTDNTLKVKQYYPVPYNLSFTLVIASKNIHDSLKIVESILPYFTPDVNVPMILLPNVDAFDVAFTLDSISQDDNYEVGFSDNRIVSWTLEFTARSWIFQNPEVAKKILSVVVQLSNDFDNNGATFLEEFTYT